MQKITRRKLKPGEKSRSGSLITDSIQNKETITEDFGKLWVNNNNLNDNNKTGSEGMANTGSDMKAGVGAGAGAGHRRASLLQQVETMQKMNKTVLTLAARRSSKPTNETPKFYWDDAEPDAEKDKKKSHVTTSKRAMSKEHAMTVLGLGRGTKRRNLTDYSEKELYDAFTEESKHLLDAAADKESTKKLNTQQDMHEAYQILLKIVKAKNRFKSKRAQKLQKEQQQETIKAVKEEEEAKSEDKNETVNKKEAKLKDDNYSDTESEMSEGELWGATKAVAFKE